MIGDMRTFANDLLRLCDKVEDQADEIAMLREYKDKYIDLLNSSTQHNAHMMGSLFALAMKPGVLDAISDANNKEIVK